jgi:hypothetical protein
VVTNLFSDGLETTRTAFETKTIQTASHLILSELGSYAITLI